MFVSIQIDMTQARNELRRMRQALHGTGFGFGHGPVKDMLQTWALLYLDFLRKRFVQFSKGGGDWPPLALSTILSRRGKTAKGLRKTVSVETRAQREEFKRYYRRRFKDLIMNKALDTKSKDKRMRARVSRARTLAKAHAVNDVRRAGGRVITRKTALRQLDYDPGDFAILRDTGTLLNSLTLNRPGNYVESIPGGIEVGIGGPDHHPETIALTIGDLARIHQEGDSERNLPKREILVPPDQATLDKMKAATERCLLRLVKGA